MNELCRTETALRHFESECEDRENEILKANLEATKDILLETESELNLATGKIEGYQECLRILRGHDDDKA